jgi:hypothetical protein
MIMMRLLNGFNQQSSHRRLQPACAGAIGWMFSSLEASTSCQTSDDDVIDHDDDVNYCYLREEG